MYRIKHKKSFDSWHFFENQPDEKPIISKSILNAGSKTLQIIKTDTGRSRKKKFNSENS